MRLRHAIPVFALIAACGSTEVLPSVGRARQSFESVETTLVDFEIDGALSSATEDPAAVRAAIEAQLFYSVGVLNGDASLGRFERLDVSDVTVASNADRFDVHYRARLPVAWGGGPVPATYTMPLPARLEPSEQQAFAEKYGATCVAEGFEAVGASGLFLHYRPSRPGCALDPSDVRVITANVAPSSENTSGKYPEYHRIWEDGTLDVVALFSHEFHDAIPDGGVDGGDLAFASFLTRLDERLAARQPDASKRSASDSGTRSERTVELPDGRRIHVAALLVAPNLQDEDATFDAFYDAATTKADLVVYGGHAGLGDNVHTLSQKGVFEPGKYLLLVLNGCDTLAYVDRTLATRRAELNPDDPSGTKYMDVVTNAMPGYFGTVADTALVFVDAALSSRDLDGKPKTYFDVLEEIDPRQAIVVTGEEDNVFDPSLFPALVNEPPAVSHGVAADGGSRDGGAGGVGIDLDDDDGGAGAHAVPKSRNYGCAAGRAGDVDVPTFFAVLASLAAARRVRSRRRRSNRVSRV